MTRLVLVPNMNGYFKLYGPRFSCNQSHRVTTFRQAFGSNQKVRWLLPAVLLFVALGSRAEASMSSTFASAVLASDDHAHYCKCDTACRGASCCCGPRSARPLPTPPVPTTDRDELTANPCLNSAPCGDSGLPNAAPVSFLSKAATLADLGRFMPVVMGRLFAITTRFTLPARRASRLDEPPERTAFA